MDIQEEINRQKELMGITPLSVAYFQKRIPFLRSFTVNVSPDTKPHPSMPDRIEMTYQTEAKNVQVMGKDEMYTFPSVSLHSTFLYYSYVVNDYTFYILKVENTQYHELPKDMEQLTATIFRAAERMNNEKLSATFEIPVRTGKSIDQDKLNSAINELNRIFFKLEESISNSSLNL